MATRDAQLGGGAAVNTGSPFAGGQTTTAMTLGGQQMGYTIQLSNGQSITVASEADYLKLKAWHESNQATAAAALGGGGGGGGGGGTGAMVDLAAEGFQAVTGFLAGSNYNTKLQDFQDSRNALLDTRDQIVQHRSGASDPALVDLMLKAVDSQLDHFDAAISVLNTQITAVDMFAGGSAAKVVSRFIGGGGAMGGMGGNGFGTVAAVGAAGLGLGLVLRNNNTTTSSRRR